VEPGPELRRLQEAILRQDVSLEAQPAAAEQPPELDAGTAPPLVGRQSELAWVRQRWERARTGRGSLEHEALENHIRHAIASDAQYGGTHCRCISDLGVSP
jgi:hypothetical protein